MKKNKIIKPIITLILISLLIYFINWNTVLSEIKNVNIYYLLIIILILGPLGIFFSSLKWQSILHNKYNINLSIKETYKLYFKGTFFNNFFISSIGGDGYKYIALKKQFPQKKKEILSSMITERAFGVLAILIINFLSIPFFLNYFKQNPILFLIEGIFIFSILFLILFRKKLNTIKKILPKNKFVNKIFSFIEILFKTSNKKDFLFNLSYSLIFIILGLLASLLTFKAIGININFLYILFIGSTLRIISMIPVSINNLGFSEISSIYFYNMLGLNKNIIMTFSLFSRLTLIAISLIGGIIYLFGKIKRIKH